MPQQPRVYCDPASVNARNIFAEMDVELVDVPGKADLMWMRRNYELLQYHLDEGQLFNHIPDEFALIDKGELTTHLLACAGDDASLHPRQFYPETYRLYEPEDRKAFFDQLPAQPNKDEPWILKPTDMSSGRGVAVVWQFDELRQLYANPNVDDLIRAHRFPRYVAQRYITNPLLLDGRKSEIRVYWLIASVDPLMVLMYSDGTARLTTKPFVMDDFSNPLVHITNVYQQKRHPDYDPNAVLKWDFARLDKYVSEDLGVAEAGYVENRLSPRLRDCLAHAVRATADRLRATPTKGHYFGLYGADFIIDENLDPWLTELQRGPGLSYSDPIKRRVIPALFEQITSMLFELQRAKREGAPLSLTVPGDFEWVLNEATDET